MDFRFSFLVVFLGDKMPFLKENNAKLTSSFGQVFSYKKLSALTDWTYHTFQFDFRLDFHSFKVGHFKAFCYQRKCVFFQALALWLHIAVKVQFYIKRSILYAMILLQISTLEI